MIPISRCKLLIPFILMSSACSVFEPEGFFNLSDEDTENTLSSPVSMPSEIPVTTQEAQTHQSLFTSEVHFVQLDEYTQQLALALKQHLSGVYLEGRIVVTPFVSGVNATSSSITGVDNLGREISIYLVNNLVELGISTSDSELLSSVSRSEFKDLVFSAEKLNEFSKLDISHILTGNMLKTNNGLMLNARVLELKTGRLIAASSKLLPNIVLNTL